MREGHMGHKAFAEKCRYPLAGAIHELIGDQKFSGPQIFLQRTDRAHRNDSLDAQQLHGVNIGPIINFAGQNSVPAAVPRQERNALPFQCSQHNGLGRLAEWSSNLDFTWAGQARHRIKAASADHADARLRSSSCFLPTRRAFPFSYRHAAFSRNYLLRSTGSNSILPLRSSKVAEGKSGSCPKATIQPCSTISAMRLRFVSSVCKGYRS